jgi:hypothetical protein
MIYILRLQFILIEYFLYNMRVQLSLKGTKYYRKTEKNHIFSLIKLTVDETVLSSNEEVLTRILLTNRSNNVKGGLLSEPVEINLNPFQLINIFVIDMIVMMLKNIFELSLYNMSHFDYILMSKINQK